MQTGGVTPLTDSNINGTQVEDLNTIKTEILSFYQQLYKEPEEWRPDFNYPHGSKISDSEVQRLQREFDEQEILDGLRACAADKAPGPDGYTMGFILHCWEVIKVDLLNTFHNFHSREYFEKSFNATYLALIQRKWGQET